jgi:VanZ family protein
MLFKKASIIFVIVWMGVIFMMSQLDGAKSWFLTGEILTVTKTGSIDDESTYDEKMESYDEDDTWSQMVFLRKFAHFAEYFIFAILLLNALLFRLPWKESAKWTLLIGIAYAIFDEVHQLFIPGRSGNVSDMMIDTLGVVMGLFCVIWISKARKAKIHED